MTAFFPSRSVSVVHTHREVPTANGKRSVSVDTLRF